MSWSICPVCSGTGKVPDDFYPDVSCNSDWVECRACDGRGVLQDYPQGMIWPLVKIPEVSEETDGGRVSWEQFL